MKREILHLKAKESARQVKSLLSIHQTVKEAIDHIRNTQFIDQTVVYFYVVDESGHLLGVVKTRDLLTADPMTEIREITNAKIKLIDGSQTTYEALLLMQKYHLLAMPVVDNGRFVGVLDIQHYFDESLKLNSSKKRLEIFQTLGFLLEEGKKQTTWVKYRTRVPWILCNMIGGIVCAIISDFYEIVLLKVIILAMFIPLVLSLSESISMQSMTQSLHEIGRRNGFLIMRETLKYIFHESKLFVLIALTCGSLVGFLSLLWGDGWGPAFTIAASIMISVVVTAIIGSLVPLTLHFFKLDPKIAAGPVVLMCADIITTLIYLSLAFWWLLGG